MRLRDVADELIHAADMEQNGRVTNDEEAVDDVEVEYESGEAAEAQRVAKPHFSDLQRPPKTVLQTQDTETGEAIMSKLPEEESTQDEEEDSAARLDLGLAPEAPGPSHEAPRMRPHQFSISVTEDGDKYFTNNETQETVWDLPDGGEVVEI